MLQGGERIDAALIEASPRLRAVSNCSAGHNNFDLPAITRAGIIATNTPEVSNESVADFAWGLLIAAARRMVECDRHVRSGTWRGFAYNLMLGVDLHNSTPDTRRWCSARILSTRHSRCRMRSFDSS